jgi:hypothetical protein
MDSLAAAHDAAVQMIDTSIVRVLILNGPPLSRSCRTNREAFGV